MGRRDMLQQPAAASAATLAPDISSARRA